MARAKKLEVEWSGQVRCFPGPKSIAKESDVQDQIRLAVAAEGVLLWRNNTGVATHGKRKVRYGLAKGSADLIGVVGPHGRFLAIECKRPKGGVEAEHQKRWLAWVRLYGGVSGFAKTVEEALALVKEARSPAAQ